MISDREILFISTSVESNQFTLMLNWFLLCFVCQPWPHYTALFCFGLHFLRGWMGRMFVKSDFQGMAAFSSIFSSMFVWECLKCNCFPISSILREMSSSQEVCKDSLRYWKTKTKSENWIAYLAETHLLCKKSYILCN